MLLGLIQTNDQISMSILATKAISKAISILFLDQQFRINSMKSLYLLWVATTFWYLLVDVWDMVEPQTKMFYSKLGKLKRFLVPFSLDLIDLNFLPVASIFFKLAKHIKQTKKVFKVYYSVPLQDWGESWIYILF